MFVVVTERIADIVGDVDAVHTAALVVSLDPADAERGGTWGYAALRTGPVARWEGVAVVAGDAALHGVPDPVRIVVRTERGKDPKGAFAVRRSALPLLLQVDRETGAVAVVRRLDKARVVEGPVEVITPAVDDAQSVTGPRVAGEE